MVDEKVKAKPGYAERTKNEADAGCPVADTDPNSDFLFFPVQGIDVNTFKEDFPMSPKNGTYRYLNNRSQIHGRKISVNGKEIALFCYGDTFYAMDEKCPHLGGPLHLGDIEDLYSGVGVGTGKYPCIVCPWHKWTFELSSGNQVLPPERHNSIKVYPVRATSDGQIQIGFSSIDPTYFTSYSDF